MYIITRNLHSKFYFPYSCISRSHPIASSMCLFYKSYVDDFDLMKICSDPLRIYFYDYEVRGRTDPAVVSNTPTHFVCVLLGMYVVPLRALKCDVLRIVVTAPSSPKTLSWQVLCTSHYTLTADKRIMVILHLTNSFTREVYCCLLPDIALPLPRR